MCEDVSSRAEDAFRYSLGSVDRAGVFVQVSTCAFWGVSFSGWSRAFSSEMPLALSRPLCGSVYGSGRDTAPISISWFRLSVRNRISA